MNRPTINDPSIPVRISKKIAPLLAIWSNDTVSQAKAAKDLLNVWTIDRDAYSLARHLNQKFNYPHNIELIAVLDAVTAEDEHKILVQEWMAKYHIKAQFREGDQVRGKNADNLIVCGIIATIIRETGQYSVRSADGTLSVVNFEHAEASQ